jgi:hypothetical protein
MSRLWAVLALSVACALCLAEPAAASSLFGPGFAGPALGGIPNHLVAGEFNEDGSPDLAVSTRHTSLSFPAANPRRSSCSLFPGPSAPLPASAPSPYVLRATGSSGDG